MRQSAALLRLVRKCHNTRCDPYFWCLFFGATLAAILTDLGRLYPGMRFRMIDEQDRMRPHIRFFVDGEQVHDLSQPLRPADELVIVQALSGG